MLNYIPTYTAIGHSSIYTGSVPSIHGIAGNEFYRQSTGEEIYCTDDKSVKTVGADIDTVSRMSPRNLQTTTITDELKLATNFRSKVLGVAIKDRGSILPAGHAADAAYWFEGISGKWVTSSWYMDNLPKWVEKYNSENHPEKFLMQDWNTLYPINTYVQSHSDINDYEKTLYGETVFPIKTSKIFAEKKYSGIISETPFGNTMTLDVAKLAVENEQLGADDITDFLAISLSSTDYIGHRFGINSPKIEDCYLRLDKDLSDFLQFLDKKVGKNNYTLFVTADHGCGHNAQFLKDRKINSDIWDIAKSAQNLNDYLEKIFGIKNIVKDFYNYQVNFNYDNCKEIPHKRLIETCIEFLEKDTAVLYAVEQKKAAQEAIPQSVKERIINGYNREFSGEIQIIVKAAFYHDNQYQGCTHGTWNPHDSHIPLLFFGKNIHAGRTNREIYVTDIAPTLAALLRIQMPNGCIGKPVKEVLK
jgi:predicted AlkP superfamily pyrophosphatase or phosphodiesterase